MMVYLAAAALAGGILCGMAGLDETFPVRAITYGRDYILYVLMFLVGISILKKTIGMLNLKISSSLILL